MKDEAKTKEELIKELQQFRSQVTRLEKALKQSENNLKLLNCLITARDT